MATEWLSWCIKKPLSRNYTNTNKSNWDGVVLHVAASEAASLYGWFNSAAAAASSHFYVRRDGTVEQYVSIRDLSWASGAGSNRLLGIETQGMGTGSWTDKQVASLVRLIKELSKEFGFPIRQMASSAKSERGIGYHAQGVPASYSQKARGVSQTGGELWSSSVGKVCPGADRIKQIPSIVKQAAGGSTSTVTPYKPNTETPKVTTKSVGCVDTKVISVTSLQQRLRDLGFYSTSWVIDGIDGDATRLAIKAYQTAQEYHPNLKSDGYWGPLEEKHYQWVKAYQSAINGWKTADRMGKTKVDGSYGSYASKLTLQIQKDNLKGAYQQAVTAIYGSGYTAKADGLPGKAMCKMVGVPVHPQA